jgi:hypothetical protein
VLMALEIMLLKKVLIKVKLQNDKKKNITIFS